MINKTKNLIIILISFGLVIPILSSAYYTPTVEIKANGLNSPISIPYNTSVNLTWTSTNSDSCNASGDWSGTKATSGSESTANLTASKSYTITCTGSGGSTIATMTVNITNIPTLTIKKLVRNLSDGTSYLDSVSADPDERVSFLIQVTAGNTSLQNLIIKDTLPGRIVYLGNLKIDGASSTGNIISGFNIDNLPANQTKTITFDASIAGSAQFNSGETTLINTVLAYNALVSNSDAATIIVRKEAGVGAVTSVSTGLTNNLFLDSFFLPLVITLLIIWIFKSHIFKFEEWSDLRKKEYREYRTRKLLQLKITKIKTQEFLRALRHK